MNRHWHMHIPLPRLGGFETRRIAAHATFEFLVSLGISRTIAFEAAFRMWAK